MKKCSFCGANSDDDAKFCPSCGGSDFSEVGAEQGSTLNGAQTTCRSSSTRTAYRSCRTGRRIICRTRRTCQRKYRCGRSRRVFILVDRCCALRFDLSGKYHFRYLRTCDFCSCKFRLRCFCSNKESFVRSEHSRVCHRDGCHDIHFGVYLHFFGNLQSIQRYRNNRF